MYLDVATTASSILKSSLQPTHKTSRGTPSRRSGAPLPAGPGCLRRRLSVEVGVAGRATRLPRSGAARRLREQLLRGPLGTRSRSPQGRCVVASSAGFTEAPRFSAA